MKAPPLGQLLIQNGKITEEQLLKALELQRKTGDRLGHTLVNMRYIDEDTLINVLEKQFGIPCIKITNKMIHSRITKMIPENICRKYRIIPIIFNDNKLTVAAADPYNMKFIDEIKFATDYNVEVVLCSEKSIMDAIDANYGKKDYKYVDEDSNPIPTGVSAAKMLEMVLIQAYNMNAREVQLEYFEGNFSVVFMTKGNALVRNNMLKVYFEPIDIRIKTLAGLDVSAKNKFQEGLMTVNIYEKDILIRVFIFPNSSGENIVLRFP